MEGEAVPVVPPVPDRFIAPLIALGEMSDEGFRTVILDFARTPFFDSQMSAEAIFQAPSVGLDRAQAREILGFLLAIVSVSEREDGKLARSVSSLVHGENLSLTADKRTRLQERLTVLFEQRSLLALAKSWDLNSDHDSLFMDSSLVTDLRPVFGREVDAEPPGFIIWHTLRISHESLGGDTQRSSVMLDFGDLKKLADQVERAIRKHKRLEVMLRRQDYGTWKPTGDSNDE